MKLNEASGVGKIYKKGFPAGGMGDATSQKSRGLGGAAPRKKI